jgi:hypothetical protein
MNSPLAVDSGDPYWWTVAGWILVPVLSIVLCGVVAFLCWLIASFVRARLEDRRDARRGPYQRQLPPRPEYGGDEAVARERGKVIGPSTTAGMTAAWGAREAAGGATGAVPHAFGRSEKGTPGN